MDEIGFAIENSNNENQNDVATEWFSKFYSNWFLAICNSEAFQNILKRGNSKERKEALSFIIAGTELEKYAKHSPDELVDFLGIEKQYGKIDGKQCNALPPNVTYLSVNEGNKSVLVPCCSSGHLFCEQQFGNLDSGVSMCNKAIKRRFMNEVKTVCELADDENIFFYLCK